MKKITLHIAWVIALLATLGSLFFGEARNEVPCSLCWYQRILMFPLAIILGIAAFRNAHKIVLYALPLAGLGFLIAIYHIVTTQFWQLGLGCKECLIPGAGLKLSFPFLSLAAFGLICFFLIWDALAHKRSRKL